MKICTLGAGYVGLVAATCFAELGNEVICVDVDSERISKLKKGIMPIYEPGLKELVDRNVKEGRLEFTTDAKQGIRDAEIIFICVGTPPKEDGSVNLEYVETVAAEIGRYMNGYKIIATKSTVPVGTNEHIQEVIRQNQKNKVRFDIVSLPEFLREGAAVKDFFNPDRTIIGTDSEKAAEVMVKLHKPLERVGKPIMVTDIKSAELIKYASNAFLSTKISFINEIARLCEKVGADVKKVAQGMGLDERIGSRFLQAGVGYGGSCFPKDVLGLMSLGKQHGVDFKIVRAVDQVNKEQRTYLINKVLSVHKKLGDKKIAVWGLAFKPKTDDVREAPALTIVKELQYLGAKIKAFDPVAEENAKKILTDVEYTKDPYEAVKGCHILVIVTEWDEFRNIDLQKIRSLMKEPNIVDGRNIYEPAEMKKFGFVYKSIGRPDA